MIAAGAGGTSKPSSTNPAWSRRAFSHSRPTRSGSARRMRRLASAAAAAAGGSDVVKRKLRACRRERRPGRGCRR